MHLESPYKKVAIQQLKNAQICMLYEEEFV